MAAWLRQLDRGRRYNVALLTQVPEHAQHESAAVLDIAIIF